MGTFELSSQNPNQNMTVSNSIEVLATDKLETQNLGKDKNSRNHMKNNTINIGEMIGAANYGMSLK